MGKVPVSYCLTAINASSVLQQKEVAKLGCQDKVSLMTETLFEGYGLAGGY